MRCGTIARSRALPHRQWSHWPFQTHSDRTAIRGRLGRHRRTGRNVNFRRKILRRFANCNETGTIAHQIVHECHLVTNVGGQDFGHQVEQAHAAIELVGRHRQFDVTGNQELQFARLQINVRHQVALAGRVEHLGHIEIEGKRFGEILPGMHARVGAHKPRLPVGRRSVAVVYLERLFVGGPFGVAEELREFFV